MFSITKYVTKLLIEFIEIRNGLQNLPPIEKLLEEIQKTDKAIINYVKTRKSEELSTLFELYQKYATLQKNFALRKRINTGAGTLLYFIYTLGGAFIGLGFSISVYFTTTGFVGHILLILSIIGTVISIVIGISSMKKERDFLLSLIHQEIL